MATLLYRGFNSAGRRVSGSVGSMSEARMKDYLHKRQITNYELFESKTVFKRGDYKLVSPKELSIFCKQMSVLFYSHLTLKEGVLMLREQTDNKHLQTALNEIYDFMEKGYTFADAICMYDHLFSSYLLNMIAIGETSGTLDSVFSQMSAFFDKEYRVRKSIKSAVTYPAVLTALMAAIIVLLIAKVLPVFGDILESMGAQMPASSRLILNSVFTLSKYAPLVITLIAALIISFLFYIRSDKGKYWFDKLKLSIPAYRYIYSRIITSRFSRSLSILLKSGVQLIEALEDICLITDNAHLEQMIVAATEKIKQGEEPVDVLPEIKIFPVLFLRLFLIGEKTGNLDDMLEKSADVFDDEADDAIKRFSDMLEPVLIIILSIIVGAILLSVMLPIITIINAIG